LTYSQKIQNVDANDILGNAFEHLKIEGYQVRTGGTFRNPKYAMNRRDRILFSRKIEGVIDSPHEQTIIV
jgi:hypothetical protein